MKCEAAFNPWIPQDPKEFLFGLIGNSRPTGSGKVQVYERR